MPGVTFNQEEKAMQRNLQVVSKKHNVVVVSVVVILVVLVVVSIIRIVGVIEGVSTGVTVEKAEVIRAASDASDITAIAGVVVNAGVVGACVPPVVVPQINSVIERGYSAYDLADAQVRKDVLIGIDKLSIAGSASAGDIAFIRYDVPSPIGNDGSIATAAIERGTSSDIDSTISGIDADGAGIIASINAAPISFDDIDGRGAEAIGRIDSPQDIGGSKITQIAAIEIIDGSGETGIS
jgi:hypothetical protein